jgi:hypothetical protein
MRVVPKFGGWWQRHRVRPYWHVSRWTHVAPEVGAAAGHASGVVPPQFTRVRLHPVVPHRAMSRHSRDTEVP